LHMLQATKYTARPKAIQPHAVKRFNQVIALRFVFRNEQRLDAAEQTQAHHLTHHTRMRMPTTERAFIIELLNERQSQIRPVFQEMRAYRGAGFIQRL